MQEMETPDTLLIRMARYDSNACIAKKDVAGVAKYWMNDFLQIAGDGSYTIGKSKVLAEWKHLFAHNDPLFERIPDTIIVSESGDTAWESGTWDYKKEDYNGNYAAMWCKIKGKWRLQNELYVSLN